MMKANPWASLAAAALLASAFGAPGSVASAAPAQGKGQATAGDLDQELDATASAQDSPVQDSLDGELELGGLEPDPAPAASAKPAPPSAPPLAPTDEPSLGEAAPPEPVAEAPQDPPADAAPSSAAPIAGPQAPGKATAKSSDPENEGTGLIFDPPNRAMEERLHRIYGRNMDPIPEDRWDMMISPRRSEVYRIRKGNTLSGISTALFGDASYWPKLWSENGNFENPHLIVPGKVVRIVPGSEEEAPAVMLVDPSHLASGLELPTPSYEIDQQAGVSPDEAVAETVLEEIEPDQPAIPDPDQAPRKPMKNLPPSFIAEETLHNDSYDRTGLEVVRSRASASAASVIPTHFWVDEVPSGIGRVAEIEASEEVAGLLQNVLLKMDAPASIGQTLSIVIPSGRPRKGALASGRVLEVGGVVEITSVADRRQNLYRAMVTKTVGPISKGSIVLAEKLPRADFTRRGNLKNVETEVIGGQYENDRKAFAAGAVIYLGAGTSSGLSPGDVLAIRSRRGARREDTGFPKVASPIAVAKVVHAQTNGSTAFVIESQAEVVPGDHTGGPLPAPPAKMFILDRARIVDIDQEVASERARREGADAKPKRTR